MISRLTTRIAYHGFIARLSRGILSDKFTKKEIHQIKKDTWREYTNLSSNLPKEKTIGARVMVRLAALTIGFYYAILKRTSDERVARKYCARMSEKVVKIVCFIPWQITRLLSSKSIKRTDYLLKWLLKFPYSYPGYDMRTRKGVVGFDVYRCPVAEYFKKHGLSELCTDAFCDVDYPLAEIWGVTLKRPKTIAKGCDYCDFRFCKKK